MKSITLSKILTLLGLVGLLVGLTVAPTAAQEPEETGDVEAQVSYHGRLYLSPVSDWLGGIHQVVPSGGLATTEVLVNDADDLYSVTFAFDYHADVATVADIEPGALFDGLVEGEDYIITKHLNKAVPLNPYETPIGSAEADVVESASGGYGYEPPVYDGPHDPHDPYFYDYYEPPYDPYEPPVYHHYFDPYRPTKRSYITISIINLHLYPLRGNGSLIKIHWHVSDWATAYAHTPIYFTKAHLYDESGNLIHGPYLYPGYLFVDHTFDPGLDFQVALEGGKTPLPAATDVNGVTVEASRLSSLIPGTVHDDGRVNVPAEPPYETVYIYRQGYLRAAGYDVYTDKWPLITLLAGDVNEDDTINIFDIVLVANVLGSDVDGSLFLEKMDFNENYAIDIADLAVVAKNYGLVGPTLIDY